MTRHRSIATCLLLIVSAAQAQTMPGMPAGSMPPGGMAGAMAKMNQAMQAAPMTGNPDRDFVAMMIPHHQGAIDMAQGYLHDGKDPAIRRLAQKVVADQQREIAEMKAWLAKHP